MQIECLVGEIPPLFFESNTLEGVAREILNRPDEDEMLHLLEAGIGVCVAARVGDAQCSDRCPRAQLLAWARRMQAQRASSM